MERNPVESGQSTLVRIALLEQSNKSLWRRIEKAESTAHEQDLRLDRIQTNATRQLVGVGVLILMLALNVLLYWGKIHV